jgi:hypothetical protein
MIYCFYIYNFMSITSANNSHSLTDNQIIEIIKNEEYFFNYFQKIIQKNKNLLKEPNNFEDIKNYLINTISLIFIKK